MTITADNVISIKILDRYYKIKCTLQEVMDLQEAALYVDEQMRKIRQSGPVSSPDRMAVVAALNIYYELLLLKKEKNQCIDVMGQRISDLQQKIEAKLAEDGKGVV